jgi:hypothetical protein
MTVNRYKGTCSYCGGRVKARAGKTWRPSGARRYLVAHLACAESESPQVIETYIPSSGWRGTQNARGRCEDAPCCGCCTF